MSATWQYVTDPETGEDYRYDNFAEFCGYAFGFSKTKVSNLLAIAEFVKLNGENVDFIDKKYAGYNTSQLIELLSVYEYNRSWFFPVADGFGDAADQETAVAGLAVETDARGGVGGSESAERKRKKRKAKKRAWKRPFLRPWNRRSQANPTSELKKKSRKRKCPTSDRRN